MKKEDVIRAWRDGEFYAELSEQHRASLPANPAMLVEVDDEALNSITGGCGPAATTGICSPCGNQWACP